MDIEEAFDDLQMAVNADPVLVRAARERRKTFEDALIEVNEIEACIPVGSIARGSQIEPINDVDLITLFTKSNHEDWGEEGPSAQEALDTCADYVRDLLGGEDGDVRLVKAGNHAVRCWLDDPDEPDAFQVDVVPAIRKDEHLQIPEADSRKWIETDPVFLVEAVERRQSDWNRFVPLVRDLKRWNRDNDTGMISLVVEILALAHLAEAKRPQAIASFFAAAAARIYEPVRDPSEVGGIVQDDLDPERAATRLEKAAESAHRAVIAQNEGDTERAACFWREVFGDIFPAPSGGCSQFMNHVGGAVLVKQRPIRDSPQGAEDRS